MGLLAHHQCIDCLKLPLEERPDRPRKIATKDGEPKRCTTHLRARKVHVKAKARGRYLVSTYNISPEFYAALLEYQDGRCYWCRLAMGKSGNMPMDHDHKCCPGPTSCGKCLRGILCHDCNTFLGFRMRDDPETVRRGARYLIEPPAQALLMSWTPTP